MTKPTAARFAVFRSPHHNPMRGDLGLIWEGDDFTEWQATIAAALANTAKGYFIHATDYALLGGGISTYSPR